MSSVPTLALALALAVGGGDDNEGDDAHDGGRRQRKQLALTIVAALVDAPARVLRLTRLVVVCRPATPTASASSLIRQLRVLLRDLAWCDRRRRDAAIREDANDPARLVLVGPEPPRRGRDPTAWTLRDLAVGALHGHVAHALGLPLAATAQDHAQSGHRHGDADTDEDDELRASITRLLARPRELVIAQRRLRQRDERLETTLRALHRALRATGVDADPRYEGTFRLEVGNVNEDDADDDDLAPLREYLRIDMDGPTIGTRSTSVLLLAPAPRAAFKLLRPFCHTRGGQRRLRNWLARPSIETQVISTRHEVVDELVQGSPGLLTTVGTLLTHVQAAESTLGWFLTRRGGGGKNDGPLSMQDFRAFVEMIDRQTDAVSELSGKVGGPVESAAAQSPLRLLVDRIEVALSEITRFCSSIRPFVEAFNGPTSFANRESSPWPSEGTLIAASDVQLEIEMLRQRIVDTATEISKALLLPTQRVKVLFEESPGGVRAASRTVLLRVTRKDQHRVLQAVAKQTAQPHSAVGLGDDPITIHRSHRSTGIWFTTRKIDALAARWNAARRSLVTLEMQAIEKISSQFDHEARSAMIHFTTQVFELDVLACFASISFQRALTRPSLHELHRGRLQLRIQGLRRFVDVVDSANRLTKRQKREHRGPSTTLTVRNSDNIVLIHAGVPGDAPILESLLFAVILNQIGCFVPCSSAQMPIYEEIFVRGGAVDDTLEDRSTFYTEMSTFARIFRLSTPRSLILVDELCRGTTTGEGLPLAIAICRALGTTGALTHVMTQWMELLNCIIDWENATVPGVLDAAASLEHTGGLKAEYRTKWAACNRRFLVEMEQLDAPDELIATISSALAQRQ